MYLNRILRQTRKLYPTGRAWNAPVGGVWSKLHRALGVVESQAVSDGVATFDALLPDNSNFTADDATDWERRLGIVVNQTKTLEERKEGIVRKLRYPGAIPARQNYRYMQRELRAAGFDVYVYENIFDDGSGGIETRSPGDVVGSTGSTQNQLGMAQLGQTQLGTDYYKKVAWSIDDRDKYFDTGDLLRRTFFIAGSTVGTFADVDASREEEFRDLICRVKPNQTVAWLIINYV